MARDTAPSPGDEVSYAGRSWVVMEVIGKHVGLASDERQELAWAGVEEMVDRNAQGSAPQPWFRRLVGESMAIQRRNRHDDNVSLVAEGIKRWQLQNDVAPTYDLGLAKFVTELLEQKGRLR